LQAPSATRKLVGQKKMELVLFGRRFCGRTLSLLHCILFPVFKPQKSAVLREKEDPTPPMCKGWLQARFPGSSLHRKKAPLLSWVLTRASRNLDSPGVCEQSAAQACFPPLYSTTKIPQGTDQISNITKS
jgi:hypothetical protein